MQVICSNKKNYVISCRSAKGENGYYSRLSWQKYKNLNENRYLTFVTFLLYTKYILYCPWRFSAQKNVHWLIGDKNSSLFPIVLLPKL